MHKCRNCRDELQPPRPISGGDLLYSSMAKLDLILLVSFGSVAVLSFTGAVLTFRKALRVSGERDGDLKMFLWAAGSMICLIIGGMSTAYILLPILFHL